MTVRERVRQHAPTSTISAVLGAAGGILLGWQNASELAEALEREQNRGIACTESNKAVLLEFARFVTGGPANIPAHPHPAPAPSTPRTPTVEDPW